MPAGGEEGCGTSTPARFARASYRKKPAALAALAARGGAWFALPDARQLHLGVEDPFRPSRKAHPAFVVPSLEELAREFEAAGLTVRWDEELAPRRRFHWEGPFGNSPEFLEP